MLPQTIGAYFAIFLIQYIPGVAFKAYMLMQQQSADTFAHTAIEIVEASGPLGVGAAMNAIAVAIFVEAVMVLAKMVERQRWEKGRAEGIKEGRKRSNAKWRAWAKEKGIPMEELPIDDEPEDDE